VQRENSIVFFLDFRISQGSIHCSNILQRGGNICLCT